MKLTDILHLTADGPFYASYITALTGTAYVLNSIVVTNPGAGYTSAPSVGFSGGGGGTGAAATAVMLNGAVIEINITNPGSGYTSAPTVNLTGGGSPTTNATANATLAPQSLDGIPTVNRTTTPTIVVPVLIGSPKKINFYYLRAGTDAESSPTIIRPNDYDGAANQKVWEWIGVNGPGGSI